MPSLMAQVQSIKIAKDNLFKLGPLTEEHVKLLQEVCSEDDLYATPVMKLRDYVEANKLVSVKGGQ